MLMRSFSFNNDELTDDALSLFEYLVEHPEYKSEFSYDILTAAMEGRINNNSQFNLVGYENSIRKNNILCIYNKVKKETSYDAPIDDDTNASMSDFIRDEKDLIDNLIEDDFYNEALNFILSNDYYLVNTKDYLVLDLKLCISNALKGIQEAVKNLKIACEKDDILREYIESILLHGVDDETKKLLEGGYCYGTD